MVLQLELKSPNKSSGMFQEVQNRSATLDVAKFFKTIEGKVINKICITLPLTIKGLLLLLVVTTG